MFAFRFLVLSMLVCACNSHLRNFIHGFREQADRVIPIFDKHIHCKFISDITNKEYVEGLEYTMFKSILPAKDQTLTCERMAIKGKQGLGFRTIQNNQLSPLRLEGFNIEAEDPRLLSVNNESFVIFIRLLPRWHRGIVVSPYNEFRPIDMKFKYRNAVEKNWAPFSKENKLMFVYSYDPLIILSCNAIGSDANGQCDIVHRDNGASLPIDAAVAILRGGSNLLPLFANAERYYVGGCHSRVPKVISGTLAYYHFTHIVVLDTQLWKIVHLSKPVIYPYHNQSVGFHSNTTLGTFSSHILMDRFRLSVIQDPVSLSYTDRKFHFQLTVNVRDHISLLYEMDITDMVQNIDFNMKKMELKYWDSLTKKMVEDVIQRLDSA